MYVRPFGRIGKMATALPEVGAFSSLPLRSQEPAIRTAKLSTAIVHSAAYVAKNVLSNGVPLLLGQRDG